MDISMNKICVSFKETGPIPLNAGGFTFITSPPERIGDEALIYAADGKLYRVMLLRSHGHVKDTTYLVAI